MKYRTDFIQTEADRLCHEYFKDENRYLSKFAIRDAIRLGMKNAHLVDEPDKYRVCVVKKYYGQTAGKYAWIIRGGHQYCSTVLESKPMYNSLEDVMKAGKEVMEMVNEINN
jgi:hypothetical protein